MKNNLLKIFLPVLSAAALISCGTAAAPSSNTPATTTPTVDTSTSTSTPAAQQVATHELYAFEAATGLPLVAELASPSVLAAPLGLAKADLNDDFSSSTSRPAVDQTVIDEIKGYLPTVEGALLEEQELITATSEASDREGYDTKMTISYTDINLAKETFTMYFTETVIPDDDNDDDDWDDRYENDNETETRIDGIVVFGENEYRIYGEKEIENQESEVKFVYQMDTNTYVQIQQEKELGESEFEYTVIQNGRTVYDYSLEVDFDDRDKKVEMEVRDEGSLKDLELEFTLLERNGETYIKVDIEEGSTRYDEILFKKVVDTSGTVSYEVIAID